jgi:hypothetical protein
MGCRADDDGILCPKYLWLEQNWIGVSTALSFHELENKLFILKSFTYAACQWSLTQS